MLFTEARYLTGIMPIRNMSKNRVLLVRVCLFVIYLQIQYIPNEAAKSSVTFFFGISAYNVSFS